SHNVTSVNDASYHDADQKNPLTHSKSYRPRPPDSYPSGSRPGPENTSLGAQTRRQKSLVKPERARNRRVINDQRIDQNNNIENLNNRWSTFDNNRRDNDDRKNQGRPSGERRSSPIVQKKKKCQCPSAWRIRSGAITNSQISILGRVFNIRGFTHPPIPGIINATTFERTAGGNDLSFLFQGANIHCKGLFVPVQPADSNGNVINYFPCVALSNNDPLAPNTSLNPTQSGCHGSTNARRAILTLKPVGDIFYDWEDVQSSKHNYVVFNGQVFDLDRLQWTVPNIKLPDILKPMMNANTNTFRGRDMTHFLQKSYTNIQLAKCMEETLRVGVVDTISIGCVISNAVMLVSLLFIAGSFREETAEEIAKREREIELWSNENNHFYPSTSNSRNNSTTSFGIFSKSRFSTPNNVNGNALAYRRTDSRPSSRNTFSAANGMAKEHNSSKNSRPSSINEYPQSRADSMTSTSSAAQSSPYQTNNVAIPDQHSLARTEYPKSHKLLLCIADGTIFGAGNDLSTPDICVSLMSDHIIHPNEVEPHSYVAIADGKKRHNRAKVYAGFYHYRELDGRQDRVPMITVAKCGGPGEENEAKAGNRVFEYYINHHLQKAFESIFGGVTCLPENGYWVPILANPDIVEQYSENIVDTLHKKNLLLLGEDRYLTTLMLKNFPKRKTLFVPQSVCKTVVPDTFRVLRSQRRRWINSTVHNLLELVLIPDLCGTFCFSMQFVIFMELVGTVVLPAAISFTMYLIVISFFQNPPPIVPLFLLAAVLGEDGRADHSRREGEFDSSHIVMKRWAEWELYKLRHNSHQRIQSVQLSPDENFNIPSTRPSSASTMYGSEKSESIPVAPLSARSGIRRKTDSLMVPPPLSDASPVNTPLNEGFVSSPGDYSQMSQPTYTSPSRSNTNSTNYSHNSNMHAGIIGGASYSNGYEENNHST
ncbi:1579_t:CDS:10, partial [Racocetra fulgida]